MPQTKLHGDDGWNIPGAEMAPFSVLACLLSVLPRGRMRSFLQSIFRWKSTTMFSAEYLLTVFSYSVARCAENNIDLNFIPRRSSIYSVFFVLRRACVLFILGIIWKYPNVSSCGRFERSNQIGSQKKLFDDHLKVRCPLKFSEMLKSHQTSEIELVRKLLNALCAVRTESVHKSVGTQSIHYCFRSVCSTFVRWISLKSKQFEMKTLDFSCFTISRRCLQHST